MHEPEWAFEQSVPLVNHWHILYIYVTAAFLGKHLYLIHSHFNMYGFRYFFVHYKVVCWLVLCVFWCISLKEIMSFLSHKCSFSQCVLNCGLCTYFAKSQLFPWYEHDGDQTCSTYWCDNGASCDTTYCRNSCRILAEWMFISEYSQRSWSP